MSDIRCREEAKHFWLTKHMLFLIVESRVKISSDNFSRVTGSYLILVLSILSHLHSFGTDLGYKCAWSTLRRVLCSSAKLIWNWSRRLHEMLWGMRYLRYLIDGCRKLHLPKTDIVSPLANIIFQRLANIRLSASRDNMKTIAPSMVLCMQTRQNTSALQKGPWGLVRIIKWVLGPVSPRSHSETMQNLKPCDYRAVLITYS